MFVFKIKLIWLSFKKWVYWKTVAFFCLKYKKTRFFRFYVYSIALLIYGVQVFNLVNLISVSQHVHMGMTKATEVGKTYCYLDGGIVISQVNGLGFFHIYSFFVKLNILGFSQTSKGIKQTTWVQKNSHNGFLTIPIKFPVGKHIFYYTLSY